MKISSQFSPALAPRFNAEYNKRMGSKAIRNNRGQVAVLFALVFTFMFVLFAFVMDFGHLIHNKMNLQIAADAAAYSGAAWQARMLNQMGAVNYHMRQDYKEMVMRFQMTHTRHNRDFPRGPQFLNRPFDELTNHSQMVCQQAHSFRALRGRQYDRLTNLCLNADPATGGLPPIVVPPVIAAFDPFAEAVAAQIREIQRQADIECEHSKEDNEKLVNHLIRTYQARLEGHSRQMEEMRDYINQATQSNFASSDHPVLASARESARRNLTISNNNSDFKIELLTPEDNQFVQVERFDSDNFATWFEFQARGSACVAKVGITKFRVPVGFEKNPRVLTYFGVKLTSKPRMLFMPQSWVNAAFPTLEAYAIAKPFGSRLGPGKYTDGLVGVPSVQQKNHLLNFSTKPGDLYGMRSKKLLAYYDSIHKFDGNIPEGNQNRGWPEPYRTDDPYLTAPLQAIRTPTIFDGLFYTVFPDPGSNMPQDYIESPDIAQALYPDFLEAAGPNNQPIQTRAPASAPYYNLSIAGRRGQGWIRADVPIDQSGSPYGTYAAEQPGTHSTTGPSSLPSLAGREAEFGFATKDVYHSAWTPPGTEGRIGYGVKFISIHTLMKELENKTNDGDTILFENKPRLEPNLDKILH